MTPLQWKRLFYRIGMWGCIAGLTALLIAVGGAAWSVYSKDNDASAAHYGATTAVDDLVARKVAVEEKLMKLDTERGIEEEVRARYQLAKPGEEVIILVAKKSESDSEAEAQSKGFWESFLGWFSF